MSRSNKQMQSQRKNKKNRKPDISFSHDLNRLEFHRNGFTLIPDPAEKNPGIAYFLKGKTYKTDEMICSCPVSRRKPCDHIIQLVELYKTLKRDNGGENPDKDFRRSIWFTIASILGDTCRETPHSVKLQYVHHDDERSLRVVDSSGEVLLYYFSKNTDVGRFLERFNKASNGNSVPTRSILLKNLMKLTLSENEKIMADYGMKSIGQVLEKTFWFRMAYHCYREFGTQGFTFHPAIEETSGVFTVTCKNAGESLLFRMVIPREKVKSMLSVFNKFSPNRFGLTINPIPLKSIFKVTMDTELDLEIRPLIQAIQEDGEARFFEREELERFRYGDLVYIKEMSILAELEPPGKMARKFAAPVSMKLKKSQVPGFLSEFGNDLADGSHIVEPSVKNLRIIKQSDSTELIPEALDRDWCWLSVRYNFGRSSISLGDILQAKREGQRYIAVKDGWVDCQSPDFGMFDPILEQVMEDRDTDDSDQIKVSRTNLFRLRAASQTPLKVTGDGPHASALEKMLNLKPMKTRVALRGLTSTLRNYQKLGLEWLRFLYENGFGGLLCDDMGIGKTHQVMALMLTLIEHKMINDPFIVVCPTTVLSHWCRKIAEHAPGLNAFVLHGGQRDIDEGLKNHKVLLTSYGILRNDIEQLSEIPFSLAVFDEIQNLKNPRTLAYEAAKKLCAYVKLGLTGTPIENKLIDLKALLDLTLPGYLGTDENFDKRYTREIEYNPEGTRRKELSNLIYPFTLRRLKQTVLDELPEKIEDIRTCYLSDDQIELYKNVISSRTGGLIDELKRGEKPVPYIHIFAVLNLLKQICDHPALVEDSVDDYQRFQSGKWDLFQELIFESLDSGQKVVVFSQYLGMIKIIETFFQDLGVNFVTLTGSTRKRGEIISRFNNDEECRCFIGSLKAGGTGIDLVAATVVIHYDRWWNAAREDQATDRVHRIGQKHSVQVFKLVTEGTLEEKISAIIEKKRNMMDSVVREDDPGLLKTFSREDLLSMLASPSGKKL